MSFLANDCANLRHGAASGSANSFSPFIDRPIVYMVSRDIFFDIMIFAYPVNSAKREIIEKTPSIRPSDTFPPKVEREKVISLPLGERPRVRALQGLALFRGCLVNKNER